MYSKNQIANVENIKLVEKPFEIDHYKMGVIFVPEGVMKRVMLLVLVVVVVGSVCSEPIYLPYSETEDVDYTIHSEDPVGCYRY